MCLKIGLELGKSTLTANSFRLNQTMKPAAPCLRMIVPLSHFPTQNWWTTGEKPVHQLFAAEYQLHSIFVALKTGTKPMVSTVSDENGALNPAHPILRGKDVIRSRIGSSDLLNHQEYTHCEAVCGELTMIIVYRGSRENSLFLPGYLRFAHMHAHRRTDWMICSCVHILSGLQAIP